MRTRKALSFVMALALCLGLTIPVSAVNIAGSSTGVVDFQVGTAVVERNGGVYIYYGSEVSFYFDNAYLGAPVTLDVVYSRGTEYERHESRVFTPIVVQPGSSIYFPGVQTDEFENGEIGHFWATWYNDLGNGTVDDGGGSEWWFTGNMDNDLNSGYFIYSDMGTFEAAGGYYWVKAAEEGEITVAGFTDVHESDYYAEAVAWAKENGVTSGTSDVTFSPAAVVTRADAMTFLWRAAGSPAPKSTSNPFADVSSNAYYYEAVLWAVEQGIIQGTSATTFSPSLTCTRDQAVTLLYRYAGEPAVSGGNGFADVSSGAYYADAVTWAVEQNITQGTSTTTFSPSLTCTRAHIVTFLYRSLNN